MIAALAVSFGLFLQAAPTTRAGTLVVLSVSTDESARPKALELTHALHQAVQTSGRFTLVPLVDALDTQGVKQRLSRAEEGRLELQKGQRAYNELEVQKALLHVERALRAFEQANLTIRFDELTRAWVLKIACLVANGESRAAELELERLLPLDPTVELSPNYFPPDVIAYGEKLRKAVAAAPKAKLTVRTKQKDPARVYLNGQYQGVTPLELPVPAADHFITLLAEGYVPLQQRARDGAVEAELEKAAAFDVLATARASISSDPDGPRRDGAARDVGKWAAVDQVLLAVVRKPLLGAPRVTLVRLAVSDGHNLGFGQATWGESLDDVLRQAKAVLADDAPRQGGPVVHSAKSPSLLRRPSVSYILLGSGAALLLGGGVFGLEALGKQREFRSIAQTDVDTGGRVRAVGQQYALVADVLLVSGLVTAVTGYVTFLNRDRETIVPADQMTSPAAAPPPAPDVRRKPSKSPSKPEPEDDLRDN